MYGLGPKLMDTITKTMFGYDSQHTATGKIPDRIDLAPKIDDSQALMREHVTFTFGRFSVPHSGHTKIMDRVLEEAGTGPHYVFATHTHDSDKNPLDYETKCAFMEAYWPDMNIFEGKHVPTLFKAIEYLEEQGFKNATLVVGQDRLVEFSNLLERYSDDYSMTIGVVAVERTDEDASATKMREAVLNEDYDTFKSIAIDDDEVTREMYDALFNTMIKPEKTLKEQVQAIMNRVPMVDGGLEDTETIGRDNSLETKGNKANIKRRTTMKRFRQIKDET
jgi:nicotinic acid mononucleotide adenylyltransferase